MTEPRIPQNETQRLRALHAYKILDTLAEQAYDDLTYLAAQICDAPIALISLVDRDRQWFKSRVGLNAEETSRKVSFCAHAIHHPGELLEVEDALEDQRFADNPLVTGDPHIRFYAGMPIVDAAGLALGTLCVIDRKPRVLKQAQRRALKALSRQVMAQIRLSSELAVSHNRSRYFESILESAGGIIYELDANGIFTYVNEYMVDVTGRERETLLKTHFLELVIEEERAGVHEHYQDAIRRRLPETTLEFRVRQQSGVIIWVSQSARLLYSAENRFERVIGLVKDITENKRLQRDLVLNQLAVNLSPVGICQVNEQARVVSFNQRYADLLGFSQDQLRQKHVYEFDPNYDREGWRRHWQEMLDKKDMHIETQFETADGSLRNVELRSKMITYEGQSFIHAICLDVTQRKRSEAQLINYKDLLDKTNDVARIGTWEVDLVKNLPVWSKVTREIHEMPEDYQPEFATAVSFYKEGENRETIARLFNRGVQEGIGFDQELEIITGKGNPKWIRTIGIPLMKDGVCERIYGMFQDISEQKRAEAQIVKRTGQLERANEELERFTYIVTHDLKLPLTNIKGHLEIIKLEAPEELEMLKQSVAWIDDSLKQAEARIGAVLEVAKRTHTLADVAEHEPVKLRPIITGIVDAMDARVKETAAVIDIAVPDALEVQASATTLASIFENLIGNALKYRRPEVAPHISVEAAVQGAALRITVSDNGLGIDMARHGAKLFQMFARLHPEVDVEGSGAGLYLTKKGVENLDGKLSVESEPGKGSVFTVELPAARIPGWSNAGKNHCQ